MGAYKFLMQAYTCDEDIYFFGFSRGAYVARFLAEMLDHVGLLSAGNEEMARKSVFCQPFKPRLMTSRFCVEGLRTMARTRGRI